MGGTEFDSPQAVYHYLKPVDDLVILYARPTDGPPYGMDNENAEQWRDVIDTVFRAVAFFGKPHPKLQVFAYAPNMVTFGVGKKLFKFWEIGLYQNTGGQYYHVLDMLPESH